MLFIRFYYSFAQITTIESLPGLNNSRVDIFQVTLELVNSIRMFYFRSNYINVRFIAFVTLGREAVVR